MAMCSGILVFEVGREDAVCEYEDACPAAGLVQSNRAGYLAAHDESRARPGWLVEGEAAHPSPQGD